MRVVVLVGLLLGCTNAREPTTAAAKEREPENLGPGYRLSSATRDDRGLEVPTRFIENRDGYEGVFPTPAAALDERWVFGDFASVCRAAFYATDAPDLHSGHAAWNELVAALAGDDKLRESKLARDGLRLHLRRERNCIYHECKPPLSPPTVTFEICDDRVTTPDPRTVARTMLGYVPVLVGHEALIGQAGVRTAIVAYRRNGQRDEVEISLDANADAQERLRAILLTKGLAVQGSIQWALDSTDKRRSYIFYPPGTSRTVVFSGRSK